MVKQQIQIELTIADGQLVLATDKRKAPSQHQQKLFDVCEQSCFQLTFMKRFKPDLWSTSKAKSLPDSSGPAEFFPREFKQCKLLNEAKNRKMAKLDHAALMQNPASLRNIQSARIDSFLPNW